LKHFFSNQPTRCSFRASLRRSWPLRRRWSVIAFLAAMVVSQASAADRIILRNLQVLTDRTVASFDLDGIVLDNGAVLGWDEIENATVGSRQAEFDAQLQDVGVHLYRVRQRLSVGDYSGLRPHAETLFPQYAGRTSASAYMVCQAYMWALLADGQREAALEPYLWCVAYLGEKQRAGQPVSLPGPRRLKWDPGLGLSDELIPVWFDREAARRVLPQVGTAIGRMPRPWPLGVRIYYASLALAAGESERARTAIEGTNGDAPLSGSWAAILQAQQELENGESGEALRQLRAQVAEISGTARPVALYWLGRSLVSSQDIAQRRDGMLLLLRIPAVYRETHRELAAASLYHTMQALSEVEDAAGSVAVRNRLLDQYAGTYFAARVEQESRR
jgi:hypothetical protein